jgi:hypothetical protein
MEPGDDKATSLLGPKYGYEDTIKVEPNPRGCYVEGTAALTDSETLPPLSQPGVVFGQLAEARLALRANLHDLEPPKLPRGWQGGRNWNAEYQALKEYPASMPNAALSKSLRIRKLVKEFCESAAFLAATIVREKTLPLEKRQVPPVNLGGIAGGEKFVQDGILFKFAIPTELSKKIFPDDESAMKAANAELRGLSACVEARIQGVYFPLMCLIDYGLVPLTQGGFRLVASSLLPINEGTLVHGSADGGRTLATAQPSIGPDKSKKSSPTEKRKRETEVAHNQRAQQACEIARQLGRAIGGNLPLA